MLLNYTQVRLTQDVPCTLGKLGHCTRYFRIRRQQTVLYCRVTYQTRYSYSTRRVDCKCRFKLRKLLWMN